MKQRLTILICAALAGCQPATPADKLRGVDHTSASRTTISNAGRLGAVERDPSIAAPRDVGEIVIQLDIYTLTVPFGGVSRNDEFWRRVDEDHVDVTAHDLMLRNGIRYGVAPDGEWPYFKKLLDQYNARSQPGTLDARQIGSTELPMRTQIEYQDLFYFDANGVLGGRTYQHCDNIFTLAYEAIPHREGDTRIRVCALVRDLRTQVVVTDLNRSYEVQKVVPEYLYDLKLQADVPQDHFLIIAPSELAKSFSSLGNTFLIGPGNAEQTETVLLLVPKPYLLRPQVPVAPTVPAAQVKTRKPR